VEIGSICPRPPLSCEVLSPILFTVYLELLLRLSKLGIGCHFGNHFVGGVGYADDVALLAPSPSALRGLLRECETFASEFGLTFNASKTQLIYFRRVRARSSPPCGVFKFVGLPLSFSDSVNHLGHILHYTLDDTADVARVISDMCRKAICLLHVFTGCDPLVKTKLIVSHCLALYGCVLWRLDCKQIKSLEIAFNNILRKVWRLPRCCHTGILHRVANTNSIYNLVSHRFSNFLARALKSDSPLIQTVYQWASNHTFTTPGFNNLRKKNFVKVYTVDDHICAEFIWDIQLGRLTFDSADILNTVLYSVCCD